MAIVITAATVAAPRSMEAPHENGISLVAVHELFRMGFLSEMKMRRHRMLKKVHQQISAKNQKSRIRPAELNALGNHFHQRSCQHETCAERDEVAQVRTLPISLHDDGAAEDVGA